MLLVDNKSCWSICHKVWNVLFSLSRTKTPEEPLANVSMPMLYKNIILWICSILKMTHKRSVLVRCHRDRCQPKFGSWRERLTKMSRSQWKFRQSLTGNRDRTRRGRFRICVMSSVETEPQCFFTQLWLIDRNVKLRNIKQAANV